MEKLRYTLLSLLLAVAAMGASAQTARLRIPEMTVQGDKDFDLPIELINDVPVVGVQFELFFPDNASVYYTTWPGVAPGRKVDHAYMEPYRWEGRPTVDGIRNKGFMIYSLTNQPFIGNSGAVAQIALGFPSELYPDGTEVRLDIKEVVITTALGENIAVEPEIGTITIAKGPDLAVSDVNATPATLMPNQEITVNWTVKNEGTLATGGGWRENIYITDNNGENRRGLTTVRYDEVLDANAQVQRTATFTLPKAPGIDGNCRIYVELSPNSDTFESPGVRGNNTEFCTKSLARVLYLETSKENRETYGYPVRASLERSGSTAEAMTFTLFKNGDDRMVLPAEVTIPAGASYEYFYYNIVNDDVLNESDVFTIATSGNGYSEVTTNVTIIDDELPALTLTASNDEITEGESFTLAIDAQRAPSADLEMSLSCDQWRRFTYPNKVTLPAGQTHVEVEVSVPENEDVEQTMFPKFRITASNYLSAEAEVTVLDNDMPTIELSIAPTTVKESAGPYAITAKLTRTSQTDKRVTIRLSDSSKGRLIYNKSIVLDKGIEEAEFSIGVVDNTLVDGDEEITFEAAVYMSSCSCTAGSNTGGAVDAIITVLDNDGPSLSVATDNATWLEGSSHTIRVSRNTEATEAMTVTLTSDRDDVLQYEKTVTIPAGESEVSVPVTVLANDIAGDGGTVSIMASAADHSLGACWVLISDQTLADAVIASIAVSPAQVEVDNNANVTIGLKNEGAAAIPARSKVNVYANGALWFTCWVPEDVAPGTTSMITKSVKVPETPIAYKLSAAANEDKGYEELSYNNNRRDEGVLTVTPGFAATVSVDKTVTRPGQAVTITGHAAGSKAKDADIEIYLIGEARNIITAKADANGDFTAEWIPYELQSGHFVVGACYPGENLTTEMAAVDVYGIQVKTDHAGLEPAETDEVNGTFTVTNSGSLPLSNIVVAVASKPDNCTVTLDKTSIEALAAGEQVTVAYTIVGSVRSEGKDWAKINFSATAAEEVSSTDYLNYYCHPLLAVLETDTDLIEVTATRGEARDYTVHLTNTGRGATGAITLAIATPWIKAVTPATMPSLAHGESADIVLSFRTDALQLNVEQNAIVGINCEKGDGIPLRIKLTPVSETVGTLTIDACDQYTYRTEEAPHLAGATVTIKSPNTYKLVTEGKTGADGHFTVELPEGYYDVTVTAPDHATYNNIIVVNPGRDTFRTVNLNFTGGVTVNYNVEPVEGGIEDKYEIVTTVVYETHVPAPVVVLQGPDKVDIDAMAVGETKLLNFYATNKGLITALDYEFFLPEDTQEYTFKCLSGTGPFDLAANQMVVFPVLLTKIANIDDLIAEEEEQGGGPSNVRRRNAAHAIKGCVAGFSQRYYDLCGESLNENKGALKLMMRACAITGMMSGLGGSGGTGGPSGGGGGGGVGGGGGEVMVGGSRNICDHDTADAADKLINMYGKIAGGTYGPLGTAIGNGVDWGITGATDGPGEFFKSVGKDFIGTIYGLAIGNVFGDVPEFIFENFDNFKTAAGIDGPDAVDIVNQFNNLNFNIDAFMPGVPKFGKPAIKTPAQRSHAQVLVEYPEWIKEVVYYTFAFGQQLELMYHFQTEMFGDVCWNEGDPDVAPFIKAIMDMPEGSGYDAVRAYRPTSVTDEQAERLFERIGNSKLLVDGQPEGVENVPNLERLRWLTNELRRRHEWAQNLGYESCLDIYLKYYDFLLEHIEMAEASICAKIKLQFTQEMVMTREAFRGTLTVVNGHESKPISDAVLNLSVIDPDGYAVGKDKMDISLESVNKFSDSTTEVDNLQWRLGDVGQDDTATATILYIPTKNAAPDKPLDYKFEGTLTYVDPFSGMTVTEEFMPTTLTVNPSPNLDMAYFMQRDVLGDDPLTPEVEAIVPAEFAVLINNVGNGDAMNVKMTTNAPQIVENEKGLLIDFDLHSSALNGKEAVMAIGGKAVTDFGAIGAGKTAFAQWWFTGSLLGHFVDYDVKATHVTSHDNPDLSLINNIEIHELIRSVKTGSEEFDVAFLCDDNFDRNDTPDHLYLSNGVVEVVHNGNAHMDYNISGLYNLHLTTANPGWVYGNCIDLGGSRRQIVRVVRNDGKEIDLRNIWKTDRTLRDGHDPLYENKIHIIDFIEDITMNCSYSIEFTELPEDQLEVVAYNGLPTNDTVLENALTSLDVVFNKAVDASTFTTDDITLTCQGKHVDTSKIGITQLNDEVFRLDLSEVTMSTGYYVLTVQTANIADTDGICGSVGRQATWSQILPLTVTITVTATPEGAGEVEGLSGEVTYGSLLNFTAVPAEGYHFDHWTDDATDNPYTIYAVETMTLGAVFSPNVYTIEYYVDGLLYHSEEIEFGAPVTAIDEPVRSGYDFSGWSEIPDTMPANDVRIDGSFASGVEAILPEGATADVYSISGVLLMREATKNDVRDRLPAGIYVIGGHKVYISPRNK